MIEIIEVTNEHPLGMILMPEIFKLRKEVYSRIGVVSDSSAHSPMVKDEFDYAPSTTHYALLEEGVLIGAQRMTAYTDEHKLPFLKDGLSVDLFRESEICSIAEATRLIIKKDKKYSGAAIELQFNTLNYELLSRAEKVVSLGNPEYKGFFEFVGFKMVNDDIKLILDGEGESAIERGGSPMVATSSTLNYGIEFGKYQKKRQLVLIHMGVRDQRVEWKTFWNRFSHEGYDTVAKLPENAKMLECVAQSIGNGKRVLDAGCGSGNLLPRLCLAEMIAGIDASEEMLKIAKQKLGNDPRVLLQRGSILDMPYLDESFDAIASVNVLYNVDDPKKALSEFWRVLAPGGIVVLSTPSKDASLKEEVMRQIEQDAKDGRVSSAQFTKLMEFNKALIRRGGFRFVPTEDEMVRFLSMNGFEVIHKERIYYGTNLLMKARKVRRQSSNEFDAQASATQQKEQVALTLAGPA